MSTLVEVLGQIEKYHDELHDIYGKIYKIYFMMPQNRSLFHKILTFNSKIVTKSEQKEAEHYYILLVKSSETLLLLVAEFETKVRALSYSDLEFKN